MLCTCIRGCERRRFGCWYFEHIVLQLSMLLNLGLFSATSALAMFLISVVLACYVPSTITTRPILSYPRLAYLVYSCPYLSIPVHTTHCVPNTSLLYLQGLQGLLNRPANLGTDHWFGTEEFSNMSSNPLGN